MGTCISSSAIHPNIIKEPPVANKDNLEVEAGLAADSTDTSNCAQYSEDVSQRTRQKPEDDMVDNILNTDIDWSSEEEHSNANGKQSKVQRKEGVVSMDISDEEYSEGEDFFWIPATLASHMGLKSSHIYPP